MLAEGGSAYGSGCVALYRVGDFTFSWDCTIRQTPDRGGEWFFGAERVQEPLTQGTVEDARGAASAVRRVVWDLCDGGIIRYASWKLWMCEVGYV